MPLRMTAAERSRLKAMARRPRSRKQRYRAEALLALAGGQPVEAVARGCRVGVERIHGWIDQFEARRLVFLDEPASRRKRTRRDVGYEEPA